MGTITLLENLIKTGGMGIDTAGNVTAGDRSGGNFSEGRMFDQVRGSNIQDQIEGYTKFQNTLSGTQAQIDGMIEKYNQMSVDARRSFDEQIRGCDDLIGVLHGTSTSYSEAAKEAELMARALNGQDLENHHRLLKGTADAVKNLEIDMTGFTTASGTLSTSLNTLNAGWEAYAFLCDHAGQKSESVTAAQKDLAAATGIAAGQVGNNMPLALSILMTNTDAAAGTVQFLLNYLQRLAGVKIDPSNWQKSLKELSNSSDEAVSHLAKLIENLMEVAGKQIGLKLSEDGKTGEIEVKTAQKSKKKKTTYTSSIGNGGYGSGRGSGGSSSSTPSSSSTSTKSTEDPAKKWREYLNKRQAAFLEELEVRVDQIQDLLDRLGIVEKGWKDEGYLTGVINTLTRENEMLELQTDVFKQNMQRIEAEIDKVKQELAHMSIGTEDYDNATKRLSTLQKKFAEYTKAVMKNTQSIKQNQQAIKDYRLQIWKQESDLRNLINKAIEDRNKREQEAFQATQKIEEKIISLIKRRYEKERDEILQNTRIKIKALQDESSALSKELGDRKQRSETEDNLKKLRELQTQYARISADPTRVKEAKNIAQQISDLQAEMAWDAAEQEVEAKQESIQQQIDELEDYADYTEDYYNNLLKDPRNFAAEVTRIMNQSMSEILEWLKRNDEEYLLATENMRKEYIDGWTDTLNRSLGIIQTNWEEVEEIIKQGDTAIINFLKDNMNEYLEADSYAQMTLLSNWQDTITNLHRAYEDLFPTEQLLEFTNAAQTAFNDMANSAYSAANAVETVSNSTGTGGGGSNHRNNNNNNNNRNEEKKEEENKGASNFYIIDTNDGGIYFGPATKEECQRVLEQRRYGASKIITSEREAFGYKVGSDGSYSYTDYRGIENAKWSDPNYGQQWLDQVTSGPKVDPRPVDSSGSGSKYYIIDTVTRKKLWGPGTMSAAYERYLQGLASGAYSASALVTNNLRAYGMSSGTTSPKTPNKGTNKGGTTVGQIQTPGSTVIQSGRTISPYATGGLNTVPGLAQLDGTANAPERVLNPKQTSLFETMVESLEQLSRINVNLPTLANLPDMTGGGSNTVFEGDIIVQVSSLSSDADYEEVADQLMNTIKDRMNRGMPIGGVRIQR